MKSLQMRDNLPIRQSLKASVFNGYRTITSFFDDTRGNISMMFGLSIVPILGLTALGTNYVYKNDMQSKAISALDAAALAMNRKADAEGYTAEILSNTSSDESKELRDYGKAFFEKNFGDISRVKDYDLDFEISSTNIIPVFTGSIETPLLGVLGVRELEIYANTEVTLPGTGKIELALVLDVTGSMGTASGGGTRMSVLKEAVDEMLTSLYGDDPDADNPNVKTSIVPFADVVNIKFDQANFDMSYMDTDAKSYYHGAHFFHTDTVSQDVELTWTEEEEQTEELADNTCNANGTSSTTTTTPGQPMSAYDEVVISGQWTYFIRSDGKFGFYKNDSDNYPRYIYQKDSSGNYDGLRRVKKNNWFNYNQSEISLSPYPWLVPPVFGGTTTTTVDDDECTGNGTRTITTLVDVEHTKTINYDMPLVDADHKVNHFDLYKSDPNKMSWKGCVESRPYPLDELDTPTGEAAPSGKYDGWDSRPSISANYYDSNYVPESNVESLRDTAFTNAQSPHLNDVELMDEDNSRFVPWFYPDQSDCKYDACLYTDGSNSFPGYLFSDGFSDSWNENKSFIRDYRFTRLIGYDYREESGSYSTNAEKYYHVVCQQRQNAKQDGKSIDNGDCYPSSNQVEDWKKINQRMAVDYSVTGLEDHEQRLRSGYVGDWNGTKYVGRYDLSKYVDDGDLSRAGATGPNRRCVTPLQPLTSSKAELLTKMAQIRPGGHTNTSIGAIWGWRVLSPGVPFTEGVDLKYEREWSKAMVLMTDGQNTIATKSGHLGSAMNTNGYLWEDRQNAGSQAWRHNANSNLKTVRICERMKKQGIRIYTVGFGISPDSDVEKMLKACATNEGETYFLASNANQLLDAFSQITEEIKQLHVSQ